MPQTLPLIGAKFVYMITPQNVKMGRFLMARATGVSVPERQFHSGEKSRKQYHVNEEQVLSLV